MREKGRPRDMPNERRLPYTASSYDEGVRRTLPYYERFHLETLDLVRTVKPSPRVWLDTGCGTGSLVRTALAEFPKTRFVLADPSTEMLKAAGAKIPKASKDRVSALAPTGSAGLRAFRGKLKADVVTAIQCHHYLTPPERLSALKACRDVLVPGGLLVVFENIAPETPQGIRIGLNRWASFQMARGKTKMQASKHVHRYGKGFFPITPRTHLKLFRRSGFRTVELFWLSYLQAGFYAIK